MTYRPNDPVLRCAQRQARDSFLIGFFIGITSGIGVLLIIFSRFT